MFLPEIYGLIPAYAQCLNFTTMTEEFNYASSDLFNKSDKVFASWIRSKQFNYASLNSQLSQGWGRDFSCDYQFC